MYTHRLAAWLSSLLLALMLSACAGFGRPQTPPTPTPTPDPCLPVNLPTETAKVSALMREFDDVYFVAQNMPNTQLAPTVFELQRIRRATEDLKIPTCLAELKKHQLDYMNTVIVTLTILMNPVPNAEFIKRGVLDAREQHTKYEVELARLLGVTLVLPPTAPGGLSPTTAASTSAATVQPTGTATEAVPLVTNPGPTTLNLRVKPALDAATVGILEVGATATVIGKTPDELWYLIQMPASPGETAWVYAQLLQLSVQSSSLPVVTPAP